MRRKVKNENERRRVRRSLSIRKRVTGTAERPRLAVFRSAKHIYAQVIDDTAQKTLASASSLSPTLKGTDGKKLDMAEAVGKTVGEAAKTAGVEEVVFDRKGWAYHGRVAALAKGAREAGLKF